MSEPPTALALVTGPQIETSLLVNLLSNASVHAGAQINLVRSSSWREKNAELGIRYAQMSSSGITAAKMMINRLNRKFIGTQSEALSLTQRITDELESAQRGLDRARLLQLPVTLFSEVIDLKSTVTDLLENQLVAIDPQRWKLSVSGSNFNIVAAPMRLHYALRELSIASWILNSQEPTEFELRNGSGKVRVEIEGNRATIPDFLLGQNPLEIEKKLRDPDLPWRMRRNNPAERGASFDLPWLLIEDMQGDLSVEILDETSFRFSVEFAVVRS